jgi:CBS domain-containing protein
MRVAELMQTEVQAVAPDTSLSDAAMTLADAHISGLPVIGRNGSLVGVISTTDILGSEQEVDDQAARRSLFETARVRDLMTPQPVTIAPGASIKEAAQLLLSADVHRLFVVEDGRLVGVLSTTDIVQAVANKGL